MSLPIYIQYKQNYVPHSTLYAIATISLSSSPSLRLYSSIKKEAPAPNNSTKIFYLILSDHKQ